MPALALLLLPVWATAAAPAWASASQIKATDNSCGAARSLTLSKASPRQPAAAGCSSSEETLSDVFISSTFLPRGNRGPVDEANVDVRHVVCGGQGALLIVGTPAETERALREHRPKPGCKVTTRHYQQLSTAGKIEFAKIPERETMTIPESLVIHARERNKIIADCNANPACRAQQSRMSGGGGSKT